MKFFIELLNGDRTQPQMQPTVPTVLLLPTTFYRVFSSLLALNTKTKLEFYRHQSLHTTARNEAAIPAGPTTTGTYSTSLILPPASDVSQLIVYLL